MKLVTIQPHGAVKCSSRCK